MCVCVGLAFICSPWFRFGASIDTKLPSLHDGLISHRYIGRPRSVNPRCGGVDSCPGKRSSDGATCVNISAIHLVRSVRSGHAFDGSPP